MITPGERDRIFEALARNEEAIGGLYRVYGEMFPRLGKSFRTLAGEEDSHAAWVRQLNQAAKEAALNIDAARFNLRALEDSLKNVARLVEEAREEDFSAKRALGNALKLEEGLLESDYFNIVKDDAVDLADLLGKLARATQIHRDKIRLMLDNIDTGL
jgi:rubrerythrin